MSGERVGQDAARLAGALTDVQRISESGVKSAAGRIRCTVEEYRQHEAAGEFWCGMGRHWVDGSVFVRSGRTTGGRYGYCRPCAADKHQREYVPQRAHVEGLKNVRYAGPSFAKKVHRPYTLTPEGAAASGAAGLRPAPPTPVVASSGHSLCPDVLGCRSGELPWGWVRERGEAAHAS